MRTEFEPARCFSDSGLRATVARGSASPHRLQRRGGIGGGDQAFLPWYGALQTRTNVVMTSSGTRSVELEVTLASVGPLVQRQLLVWEELTLGELHDLIQLAMGWDDEHLHEFDTRSGRYGSNIGYAGGLECGDEEELTIGQALPRSGSKLRYTYDLGDCWEHEVVRKKTHPRGDAAAQVIGGKGACPPEDCGGGSGYGRLLEAIDDPTGDHGEEGLDELLEEGFDPAHFDLTAARERVAGWLEGRAQQSDDTDLTALDDSMFGDFDEDAFGDFTWAVDNRGLPLLYDPNDSRGPEKQRFQDAGEDAQLAAIATYHRLADEEVGESIRLHCVMHLVVETQLMLGEPPQARVTFDRLRAEGLDRHDAVHALGFVVAEQLFQASRGEEVSEEAYMQALAALTAESWRATGEEEEEPTEAAPFGRQASVKPTAAPSAARQTRPRKSERKRRRKAQRKSRAGK